jgi:putative membrane-bound dehydrogenase-like protein
MCDILRLMRRRTKIAFGGSCGRIIALSLLVLSAAVPACASFPKPYNSERDTSTTPLPPDEAAAAIALPAGFRATVFAAEPDVANPIALAWDARGRLWIAENYTYAENTLKFDLRLRDRILIFEGAEGDRFTSRRVFADDLQRLTSVEVGHGGVWAMCLPQLLFIPDRDGDGVADGPAEVVLDGFEISPDNHHTGANGLRFGPDGWLYGRCGASSTGEIGPPGAPPEARVPLRGTVWRYHPYRRIVEVLSAGTTNPYGHDWNEHGELFFINTVNGHLWHGITGAHYKRPHTLDPNPAVYALIDQHADHWHFDTGQGWTKSRDGAANTQGGGHAHVGMMIYQGDNFPAEYRGRLFTLNFHGRRANQEILERLGSGYVARHGPDFFVSGDKWFRGQEISTGPDGGVFVLDWSDTGECHESTGVHRESGRIFKIAYGTPKPSALRDVTTLSAGELAALHGHSNEWLVRQARLELAARAAAGRAVAEAKVKLRALYEQGGVVVALRALWTLHAMEALEPEFLRAQLRHHSEHVRTWAIRLLSDRWPLDTVMSQRPLRPESAPAADLLVEFHRLATRDSSGLVRLALASLLQRLPPAHRATLAGALVARAEDATDHNLPLLIWYGLIPLAATEPLALVSEVAARCELPQTREFIARRLAEDLEHRPGAVNELLRLAAARPPGFQADIATGLASGLKGWRKASQPAAWESFAAAAEQAGAAPAALRELRVLFGDGRALDELRQIALDPNADLGARQAALRSLIETGAPDLRQICEQALGTRALNTIAVQGLARFDDPAIGTRIARSYRRFAPEDREGVITALITRPAFAAALLEEVVAGRIPRTALTPFHARQIRALGDEALNRTLAEAWGEAREPAADKRAYIERLRAELTPDILATADKRRGRVVYANVCGSCHTLHGQGGRIGPDLTGSNRDNLDYLLEHTLDPNAVITADFRLQVITLRDGRTLSGFVSGRTARTLTLNTTAEEITVENADIVARQELPQSLMPEGILEALPPEDVSALIAYLMHPTQVPLPAQ